MSKILRKACAGTFESSDAYVEISPGSGGIELDIDSVVEQQFGEQIRTSATAQLEKLGIENAHVILKDRGALDCVICARIEAAVKRGAQND